MKVKWWFSILLGVSYLAVFNLWRAVSPPWIVVSGLAVSACLGALLIFAASQRYFFNLWDGLFHASVILDIVLEATMIRWHEHVGFYLCAAAFAVVLVGYRLWLLRGRSPARAGAVDSRRSACCNPTTAFWRIKPMANHDRRSILSAICLAFVMSLAGLASIEAGAPPALACPIPLEKGTRWTYEGIVRWTPVNSGARGPIHIQWAMEVVDTLTNQTARAAVVRGMPDELTGYEAGFQPGYSVLLCVSNRVYRFGEPTEQQARSKAQELLRAPPQSISDCNEFLVLPLAKGKEWAGDTERPDHWYRWYVEAERRKSVRVKGYPGTHPVSTWRIAYRTCPEHEIMEIAEGLGITRFVYEHHGTIQSADVRLVSVSQPPVR